MRFEQFSPDEPVKVRKATAHEMEVFIHHAAELTRFGMVPYFAPIINEIRVVMINTNKAYVDKDWRVALPEGSLDSFDAKDTPVEIIREVLRLVILQHDRAAKNVMSDEEVSRVSFDLEINQRLNGFNGRLKLNRDGEEIVDLLPEDYDLPAFGIAEEYYSTVLSYMRESEMPDMGSSGAGAPQGGNANPQGGSGGAGGSSGTSQDGDGGSGSPTGSMSGSASGVSISGASSNAGSLDNSNSGGSEGDGNGEEGNNPDSGADNAGEDDSSENGTGNDSDSNEESDGEGSNSGADGDSTDEEDDLESGTGGKTGSSKFVTEAELVAMMDAVGLQRADNQTQRRKRNDMLALVQEEMRSKSIGSGAGNTLLDWVAKSEAGNTAHWSEMLRRVLVIASNQRMAGDTIRTYRRPNFRLQCALPDTRIILPTTYDVRPNVYVGVDTSGSMMNSEDIGRALGNIERIFEEFQTRAEVRISAIDTELGEFQSVKQIKDIEFTGGGGTDMVPFVNALNSYESGADKEHPPATLGILITDGYIDWEDVADALKEKHNYKLAIVLTSKHAEDVVESMEKHFNGLLPDVRPEIIPVTIYN